MDPAAALTGLFTLPFLVLCVVIGLFVAGLRWTVEKSAEKIAYIFPDKYESWWVWLWREAILPISPLVVGALIAYFVKDYPYPAPFDQSNSARLFIGVIAGLSSGFLYPRVMFYLRKFAPQKLDAEVKENLEVPEEK
jgi:hypothetical protein